MKKNIFKILCILFVAAFFYGCDEDEGVIFSSGNFLQLSSDVGDIGEGSDGVITTSVMLGAPSTSAVTVNFSVTSSDNSRFEIVSDSESTITIPAGETSAELVMIMPIDNFDTDGNQDIIIELLDTSSLPIGVGGDGLLFAIRTITIVDNDCPIDIDSFVGVYDVSENFTDGPNSPSGLTDFFGESYQMEITLMPGDITGTKVILTNSIGFDEYIPNGTIMSFDTCNGEVIFDDGFPTVGAFTTFEFNSSSYEEANNSIQATGPLSTFGDYQFTLTKQ